MVALTQRTSSLGHSVVFLSEPKSWFVTSYGRPRSFSKGGIDAPLLQNTINNNAAATSVEATFWIEHVEPKDATGRPVGRPFDVLQYTQTVILNFLGIDWPHITVSTMFRQ
jgi:hypothetical protein